MEEPSSIRSSGRYRFTLSLTVELWPTFREYNGFTTLFYIREFRLIVNMPVCGFGAFLDLELVVVLLLMSFLYPNKLWTGCFQKTISTPKLGRFFRPSFFSGERYFYKCNRAKKQETYYVTRLSDKLCEVSNVASAFTTCYDNKHW